MGMQWEGVTRIVIHVTFLSDSWFESIVSE